MSLSLTGSSPPLRSALHRTVKQVAQTALDDEPAEAAITLIDRHEELEVELSILQQYLVYPELADQEEVAT